MKKILIAATTALIMSVTSAQAEGFADDLNAGAGIGIADLGLTDSAFLFYATVEKPLDVELGEANSVAQLRLGASTAASQNIGIYTIDAEVDYLISVLFKSSLEVQDRLSAYGMVGLSYASVTESWVVPILGEVSGSSSNSSFSFGIGADYEVDQDLKVGIEYARYFADVTAVAVNATFSF